jgi:glyoxylase-like metal-dependent hydrolase (beta-lactamase superfamily II)
MRYNAGVLASAGQAWLIDPGPHPDEVAEAADLAAGLGAALVGIVLTHSHWDHILGPERLPDVPVIAHEHFEATLALQRESTLRTLADWDQRFGYHRSEPFSMPLPSATVSDGQRLGLGELELQLLHIPGHAADQVAIYEPGQGALWAADTLSDLEIPYIIHSLVAYEHTLTRLAALPIRLVVPGHGDPSADPSAIRARIDDDRAYLAELRARIEQVLAAEGSLAAALEACASMSFREPEENRGAHRLNVESVYLELGGPADPRLTGWAKLGLSEQ